MRSLIDVYVLQKKIITGIFDVTRMGTNKLSSHIIYLQLHRRVGWKYRW